MRIFNPADTEARQWVDVISPVDLGPLAVVQPQGWTAVGGSSIGDARTYHVLARIPARKTETGALLRAVEDRPPPRFRWSSWVSKDYSRLVPRVRYSRGDRTWTMQVPDFWEGSGERPRNYVRLIDENPARLQWHMHTVTEQLVMECWARIYADQDWVELSILLAPLLETDAMSVDIDRMELLTAYPLAVDYATRKGIHKTELHGGAWVTAIWDEEHSIGRGQLLPVQGALLCVGQPHDVQRLGWLGARSQAPVLGQEEWPEWLGFKQRADLLPEPVQDEARARVAEFGRSLQIAGEIGDVRPYGLLQSASAAGEQEDFGASKGVLASYGDPAWQYYAAYSCEGWALRPQHNLESDGHPVLHEDHPETRMWSGYPHATLSRDDLLGWPRDRPSGWSSRKIGSWSGMDDQHYSINNLVALYRVTGLEWVKRVIRDILECDAMRVPNRLGNPRAVGRRLLGWAHVASLHDGELSALATEQIASLMVDFENEADFLVRGFGEEVPIQVVKPTNEKYGWLNQDGSLVQCWVTWMESFVVQGLRACAIQLGDPLFDQYAYRIARTITMHGFYYEAGEWHAAYGVRSVFDAAGTHTGTPIDPGGYTTAHHNDVWTWGSWSWSMPAVRILRELAQPGDPALERANILEEYYRTKVNSWNKAEMLACGKTTIDIPPEPPAFGAAQRTGRVGTDRLVECSGLGFHNGVLWGHNDSGDPQLVLYALSLTGDLLGAWEVAGATVEDCEDLAIADGYIWIGDIGNSEGWRREAVVWKVPIPDVRTQQNPIEGATRLVMPYSDGARVDAESLLVANGRIYIATKAEPSTIYRSSADWSRMEPIGRISLGTPGAGDFGHGMLAFRNRSTARIWATDNVEDAIARPPDTIVSLVVEPQGEALALTSSGFYTTSEGLYQPILFYPRTNP